MSKERIHEILKENTGIAPDSGAAIPILQAMEQYGKEMYTNGCNTTYRIHEDILADCDIIINDNKRLRSLVKAQKELIAIYEKAITLGEPDVWELYSQIKKLEQ